MSATGSRPLLLAIIELGGYRDFAPLYKRLGYAVQIENTMRKSLSFLKKQFPRVVVAEFNFDPSFRDRLSNLESLIAAVQRMPDTRMIVFYEQEVAHLFDKLRADYEFFDTFSFPIDEVKFEESLKLALHS